jgi:hypothetical protein
MPSTVKEYINSLSEERKQVIEYFLKTLKDNLPNGFEEVISYGMPGYVVPHSIYPDGYHCDPSLPLPFIGLASQKNFVALYHMGIYANPELLKWFMGEYPKHCKSKLDMGKSCIRFKKLEQIPYDLIAELAGKMTVQGWITIYEKKLQN